MTSDDMLPPDASSGDWPLIHKDFWLVHVPVTVWPPENLIDLMTLAFDDMVVSYSVTPPVTGQPHSVEIITDVPPDMAKIQQCLDAITTALDHPGFFGTPQMDKMPERDWLQHVYDQFPPLTVGGFYIYGSHYEGDKPAELDAIQIDAATAFGSGEHPTTFGCLEALRRLKDGGAAFANILDMGCGSGILAIAAQRLWPDARITAIDIDPEAVRVTDVHAALNDTVLSSEAGDGYDAPMARKNAPYDLILANILAGPLIAMAPATAEVAAHSSHLILAGLLTRQMDDVVAAHRVAGWESDDYTVKDGWPTVVMTR